MTPFFLIVTWLSCYVKKLPWNVQLILRDWRDSLYSWEVALEMPFCGILWGMSIFVKSVFAVLHWGKSRQFNVWQTRDLLICWKFSAELLRISFIFKSSGWLTEVYVVVIYREIPLDGGDNMSDFSTVKFENGLSGSKAWCILLWMAWVCFLGEHVKNTLRNTR